MRVLIVDDSMFMRALIKRTLDRLGYQDLETAEAGSAEEALPLLQEFKPDAVLVDWSLPKMSGLDLVKHIRQTGLPIKFGFITAIRNEENAQRAQEAGAAFYIVKPFTGSAVREGLKKILPQT